MELLYLSTTLISGYVQCPARALDSHAKRAQHGNDFYSSEPTRFGNVVHDVCERAHEMEMRGEELPPLIDLFDEAWRKRDCTDQEYHSLGRDLLPGFLDRTLHDREGETICAEFHFLLDIAGGKLFPLADLVPAEIRGLCRRVIEEGGVPVISKVDRIDRVHRGKGKPPKFVVTDYKSNAQPFTRDEIRKSVQLGIYDLAVRTFYGDEADLYTSDEPIEVECVYDMLRWGRFPVSFDDDFRDELRAYLINLWFQVQESLAGAAPYRINPYCHACEIRGDCPAYARVLEQAIQPVLTDDTNTPDGIVSLVEEFEGLKSRAKLIDKRIDEVAGMLSPLVTARGSLRVDAEREVVLQPNRRFEYAAEAVIDLFTRRKATKLLPRVLNVSTTAIDRALKGVPWRDEALALRVENYIKSSLKVRRVTPTLDDEEAEG